MAIGNEIAHAAAQAIDKGYAETSWAAMRNAYFRGGSNDEAWDRLVRAFDALGVTAWQDSRQEARGIVIWVCLRPKK